MTEPILTGPTGEPAAPQQVGPALRAVVTATLFGAGTIAIALWGARTLQLAVPAVAGTPPPTSVFIVVVGGTLGGIGAATAVAWTLLAPLVSAYRRGGLSMVAGFATALAMLPAAFAEQVGGRWGLLGYGVVALLLAVLLTWGRTVPSSEG
ncbi:MAG: hypothetical protein ABI587_13695 [Gemmatimonadales bacterium]